MGVSLMRIQESPDILTAPTERESMFSSLRRSFVRSIYYYCIE